MIEVRIDLSAAMRVEHEVTYNIKVVEQLKAAGVPLVGKLVCNGVTHGTLVQTVEEDLDGDTLIYKWYDRDELKLAALPKPLPRNLPTEEEEL